MPKSLNPADAHRKAQRKKELKKNKADRAKAREFALVKKDTRDLEDEVEKLEAGAELSSSDKSRLTSLKNELSKIAQKKEEYVKEHPEHRKLVYRSRRQEGTDVQKGPPPVEQKRNLFNKHGLPRHPERSIYYDPVMNPYGVPPPGMPYVERPLTADEVDSGEDVGDEDEDIIMPEGPPPGASTDKSQSDSDDEIPMPEGPPPGKMPDPNSQAQPGLSFPPFPPPLPHIPSNASAFTFLPPPLPGFFPPQTQSAVITQDPLSSVPHYIYQAHRVSQLPPSHPSLPPKPSGSPATTVAGGVHPGAIISAKPELRDLKKEATAFVPASLKRKRAAGLPSSSRVNAAPSVSADSEGTSPRARPDLVGMLKSQLGAVAPPPSNSKVPDSGPKVPIVKEGDDYQKFVDEVSDLLGPPRASGSS